MTTTPEQWDDAEAAALFTPVDGRAPRCPAPELLAAARSGTLPPQLQTAVSGHLATCVMCRTLADALEDDAITALQPDESARILGRIRPSTAGVRRWPRTAGQGALLTAAVLLIATAAWRIVKPEPSAPTAHLPQFDIAVGPVLPSDARGPLAAGRQSAAERLDLLQALVPYREGDYARATTEFAALVARHPQSAAGHFYLGLSELMRGRSPNAIGALETAYRLESPESDDASEMLWYLAVAQYRAGRPDLAQATLSVLCTGRSIRSAPACAALGTLSVPRTLRVTVTDTSGTPLSGVLVGEHVDRSAPDFHVFSFSVFSGRTDATGRVEISGQTVTSRERLLVRAAKPGFFTSAVALPAGLEMQHHFTLRPWVMTAMNQTIRGTTRLDAFCEAADEPCQRYAVTAPRNGRLDVSVRTSVREGMDLWVEMPGGDIYGPRADRPLQLEFDAIAGTTYEIRVLSFRGVPREFELSIRIR
jgi:hypothetical protein